MSRSLQRVRDRSLLNILSTIDAGVGTKKNLIRAGFAPRSDPLAFYIPFLAEKIPLLYTFC